MVGADTGPDDQAMTLKTTIAIGALLTTLATCSVVACSAAWGATGGFGAAGIWFSLVGSILSVDRRRPRS